MMPQSPAARLLATSLLVFLPFIWRTIANNRKLGSIPTAGPSGFFAAFITSARFLKHGQEIIQDGYNKHRGSVFKVPMMMKWMIVVSGSQMIEELRHAPDEVLSLRHAVEELLSTDVTLGVASNSESYHIDVLRTTFTRNIGIKFPDIVDEISTAFSEHIPAKDEWIKVVAYPTIMDIVCRASNRLLVGLPLCRNPDYLELNKDFTIDVFKAGMFVHFFPPFLRSFAGRLCTRVPNDLRRCIRHLEPLIKERLELQAQYGGDWTDKPNDMLSWLLDAKPNQTVRGLALCILVVNFAAIHTSSAGFTQVLYDMATRPEYVEPMRKELEAVIREEGWSKASVGKLHKLDSFIKESLRLSPMGSFVMLRKALKDFTFSDGTTIPAGSLVSVPLISLHQDEEYYPDGSKFDGFRFERMRDQEGVKHQLDAINANYFLFGQGRHACPGRFFASNELKTMLAYVLLNYDVKMASGNQRPSNWSFGEAHLPDPSAEVMFRKRA